MVSARPFSVSPCLILLSILGCAGSSQYRAQSPADEVTPSDVTIVYGKPHRVADRLGYVVGLPERMLTVHPSVNNHEFSEKTREQLLTYLRKQNITDVYVRVNQYNPAGEWQRLRENTRIAPGWKYTVGLLPLTAYTLIPGRIFGGDMYNPFTNSLYINSDIPSIALHEAAYAKDVRSRKRPGTYAAVNEIPFVAVWRHLNGIHDVIEYAKSEHDWETERETYRVVYPMIGIHMASGGTHAVLGNEPLEGIFFTPLLPIGGALAGHAVGKMTIARRLRELAQHPGDQSEDATIQLTSQLKD